LRLDVAVHHRQEKDPARRRHDRVRHTPIERKQLACAKRPIPSVGAHFDCAFEDMDRHRTSGAVLVHATIGADSNERQAERIILHERATDAGRRLGELIS
jgi:hypothetical protein